MDKVLGLLPSTADNEELWEGNLSSRSSTVSQMILNLDPIGKWTLLTLWVTSGLVSFNTGK